MPSDRFASERRNWLFSQTTAGAAACARLYSLVETVKADGLEPHAYLSHLFSRIPKAAGTEYFEALPPRNTRLVG
jgi:transposase